jgi:indole-3-glycerol phosphate synthase
MKSSSRNVIGTRAVKDQRLLDHTYRTSMSALVEVQDPHELAARRELYRRLACTGD